MYARLGEKQLDITLSSGVTFHVTPTLLISTPEYRIIPFTMIKERKGNWREVKEWLKTKLGWDISFYDKTPINFMKEVGLIEKFEHYGQKSFRPNKAKSIEEEEVCVNEER